MVRAIFSAEPAKVPGGGCVESVVTRRTHSFRGRPFVFDEVEGITVPSDPFHVLWIQIDRDAEQSHIGSKHHAGVTPR
jgi:hypothetical protein